LAVRKKEASWWWSLFFKMAEEEATQQLGAATSSSIGNGTNHVNGLFGLGLEEVMARPGERRIPTALKKLFLFLNGDGSPHPTWP
jgi:hypothetical protein